MGEGVLEGIERPGQCLEWKLTREPRFDYFIYGAQVLDWLYPHVTMGFQTDDGSAAGAGEPGLGDPEGTGGGM